MKGKISFFTVLIITFMLISPCTPAQEQKSIVMLEKPMWDFELQSLDGKTVKLSDYQGKNVMLVFPRVFYATDTPCSLCGYQYLDINDEFTGEVCDKLNLQILFIFPYDKETVSGWLKKMPEYVDYVYGMLYPEGFEKMEEARKKRIESFRIDYPKIQTYKEMKDIKTPMNYPVLLDSKRDVSNKLDIFRTEWSGGKGDQNIPTIIILDSKGMVRFKYVSQNTLDRPSPKYIIKYIKKMVE